MAQGDVSLAEFKPALNILGFSQASQIWPLNSPFPPNTSLPVAHKHLSCAEHCGAGAVQ